jgi:hypothetical protein
MLFTPSTSPAAGLFARSGSISFCAIDLWARQRSVPHGIGIELGEIRLSDTYPPP